MKTLKHIGSAMLGLLLMSFPVLAQPRGGDEVAGAGCAMLGCGAYIVFLLLILAAVIGITVFIFKWIKKDALARGDNPSKAWFALLGLLGLLIYVLTRPQGNVLPCPSCQQPRMQGLPRCPNCGNA